MILRIKKIYDFFYSDSFLIEKYFKKTFCVALPNTKNEDQNWHKKLK